MRHKTILTLALTTLATTAAAQGRPLPETLRAYVQAQVDTGRFQGNVLVTQNGRVLYRGSAGYADRELRVRHTAGSVFRIGSLTKTYTALAILRLQQDGRLDVHDRVSRYVPGFPHGDRLTIHHLLTHTSGLVNHTDLPGFTRDIRLPYDEAQFLGVLGAHDLASPPGSRFAYNNAGYTVLATVIEKVTGKTFAEALGELLLTPGGLASTRVDDHGEIVQRRARGYDFSGEYRNADFIDPTVAKGAGDLRSTTADVARLFDVIEQGNIFNPASRTRLLTGHADVGAALRYGYGVFLGEQHGRAFYGHGGNTPGFTSYAKRFPGERLTVVVLGNVSGAPAERMAADLASIVLGEAYTLPRALKNLTVPADVFNRYEGSYQMEDGSVLYMTVQKGRLLLGIGAPGTLTLLAQSDVEFHYPGADADINFIRDGQGRTTGLVLLVGGMEMKGQRLSMKQP